MADLKSPALMWLKASLFLAIGIGSSAGVLIHCPSWRVGVLLALAAWGFCRAYYFAFYVIEHWIDPGYRYAGLWDFVRSHVLRLGSGRRP